MGTHSEKEENENNTHPSPSPPPTNPQFPNTSIPLLVHLVFYKGTIFSQPVRNLYRKEMEKGS
jgi:hypothetical protein